MASEADQVLHDANEPVVDENKSASRAESDTLTSSSSNTTIQKMANKTPPPRSISDYWKKSTITKDDHFAYHATSWLSGELESIVPTMEYPMVDGTTVVCFESHLIAGLGLPPS
jgi:hypothetical protein